MINDFLSDINKPINNILYSELVNYGPSYYTLSIYNPNINIPLQKFWLYIMKAKVINKEKEYISLALSYQDNDKLINYITSIETHVFDHLKNNIKCDISINKKTIINDSNFYPIFKLKLSSSIPIFTHDNLQCSLDNISIGSHISLFVELDYIIIAKKEVMYTWKILQIKQLVEIDFSKSLFLFSTPITPSYAPSISPSYAPSISPSYAPPIAPSYAPPIAPFYAPHIGTSNRAPIASPQHNTQTVQDDRPTLSISANELLSQISKLNKVNKTEKIVDKPIVNIIELKKTVSREPLPISSWYNNAIDSEIVYKLDVQLSKRCQEYDKIKNMIKSTCDDYNKVYDDFELLSNFLDL
jgi:hypothetical protein